MQPSLVLDRQQILAFRRRVGGLAARMPAASESLRRAAWAGLKDSMPRAALLSLHARVDGVEPSTWEDSSLAQLWGPRYHTYVVARRDFALFSLGRLPEDGESRLRAEGIAEQMHAHLAGRRMTDREVEVALGLRRNELKHAAPTGTVAIRWEGARAPIVWTVPAAETEPAEACRELACRYLHIFGPSTADRFAGWAGITRRAAARAFTALEGALLPVRSPLGAGWLLADDEPAMHAAETTAGVRLLPSGDAYFLLDGAEREFLVPRADRRGLLWTSRVWPGALLVDGEIVGTWRRAKHTVRIETWARLSRKTREAVETEASTLPLPGLERQIEVAWNASG